MLVDEPAQSRARPGEAFERHSQVVDDESNRSSSVSRTRCDRLCDSRATKWFRPLILIDVHDGGDRSRLAVLKHLEVLRPQGRHMAALPVGDDGIDLHELDAEPEDRRLVHRMRLRGDGDGDDEAEKSREAPHTSCSLLIASFRKYAGRAFEF